MKISKIWGLSLCMVLLVACSSPIEENMSRDVHEFTATNQNGETLSLPKDLEGDYWVADFIFTSCETVCPPMTGNMARLQQQVKTKGLDAQFISFSVDPEQDTKKKLKTFANNHQADHTNWDFLTGYTYQAIKELSIKSFQSPVKKLDDSNQYAHGTSFFLITPEGEVIKRYNGTDVTEIEQIVNDLTALQAN